MQVAERSLEATRNSYVKNFYRITDNSPPNAPHVKAYRTDPPLLSAAARRRPDANPSIDMWKYFS